MEHKKLEKGVVASCTKQEKKNIHKYHITEIENTCWIPMADTEQSPSSAAEHADYSQNRYPETAYGMNLLKDNAEAWPEQEFLGNLHF